MDTVEDALLYDDDLGATGGAEIDASPARPHGGEDGREVVEAS